MSTWSNLISNLETFAKAGHRHPFQFNPSSRTFGTTRFTLQSLLRGMHFLQAVFCMDHVLIVTAATAAGLGQCLSGFRIHLYASLYESSPRRNVLEYGVHTLDRQVRAPGVLVGVQFLGRPDFESFQKMGLLYSISMATSSSTPTKPTHSQPAHEKERYTLCPLS